MARNDTCIIYNRTKQIQADIERENLSMAKLVYGVNHLVYGDVVHPVSIYTDTKHVFNPNEQKPPYNPNSLQVIIISWMYYFFKSFNRKAHDNYRMCSIKSVLIKFVMSLVSVPLPEHYKIEKILKCLHYRIDERNFSNVGAHVCCTAPTTRYSHPYCEYYSGRTTHTPEYDALARNDQFLIRKVKVFMYYSGIKFGTVVLNPTTQWPLPPADKQMNRMVDSFEFTLGKGINLPEIRADNLVDLYMFFKHNMGYSGRVGFKSFKCCDQYFVSYMRDKVSPLPSPWV